MTTNKIDSRTQIQNSVTMLSGNTTLGAIHYRVVVTSAATITLPTAVGVTGREYAIKATTNNVIVNTTSSQTIDGALSKTLNTNDCMIVFSNGSNWLIG